MKYITSTPLALFCILFILSSTFSSCGLFGSDTFDVCGKVEYKLESITADKLKANPPAVFGNEVTYSYSFTIEDMCPEIHIKAYWTCEIYEEFSEAPTLHTDVFWSFFYQDTAQLTFDRKGLSEFDHIYTAKQEIGLKQAYGENPAWAIFTFYLTFPSKGSDTENEEYFDEVFNFASGLVTYYHLQ